MNLACKDHVEDIGPRGVTSHVSIDGSSFFDRIEKYGQWETTAGENIMFGSGNGDYVIMMLLIDDGVHSRGHRTNIFNGAFGVCGIATGPHTVYTTLSVITYAGSYTDANQPIPPTIDPPGYPWTEDELDITFLGS